MHEEMCIISILKMKKEKDKIKGSEKLRVPDLKSGL